MWHSHDVARAKKTAETPATPARVARQRKQLPPADAFDLANFPEAADAWPRNLGLASWTKPMIDEARAALARGQFRRPVELWRSAKTDAAIYASALNRIAPMAGLPMDLVAGSPEGHASRPGGLGERAMIEGRLQFLGGETAAPLEVLADVNEELAAFGLSVCQNVRREREDGSRVDVRLENWPLEYVEHFERGPDGGRGLYAQSADRSWTPIVHGDGQWVVFQAHAQEPWTWGALMALCDVWASRAFARRDRTKNSESQGDSKWIGTLPQGIATSSPEGVAMLKQLLALYQRRRAMLKPYGSEVERNEAMSQNWQIFKEIIESDNTDAAKILLGQDVSNTANTSQRLSSAQIFGIRNDLVERDLNTMARAINTGTIRPWQAWNFGRVDLVDGLAWQFPDFDQDTRRESLAKRYDALVANVKGLREAGINVTQDLLTGLCADYGLRPLNLADLAAPAASGANPAASAPERLPDVVSSAPSVTDAPANDVQPVAAE